jgi:hypothetical protein
MKNKKNEDEIVNYRLEKINKIKKKPVKKGFQRLFEEKNVNMNVSNLADGSMSSKIFNKSGNKKNITLRIRDFEEDSSSSSPEDRNPNLAARIKIFSYLIYIISFFIYRISLFNCGNKAMNECIEKYNIKMIIDNFIKCIISGFILSFNLSMVYWQLLATTHLFGFIAFLFLLLVLDTGNNLYNHGLINFVVLLITLIYGFLFFCLLKVLFESIFGKKYKTLILMLSILILSCGAFTLIYLLVVSCRYWDKGIGNNKIDNDPNKYSCSILKPRTCYMDMLGSFFDFSKIDKYTCEKNNNPNFVDVLDSYILYYDKEFSEDTKVLNYPKTTSMNLYSENDISFDKKIMINVKGTPEKDLENSEVFLVRNKTRCSIEMDIKKNITLENERKQLTNYNAKIRNIIIIYFDSLSRAHFHRKFSDFSSFVSDMSDLTNNNYDSFEFFKYHTFGNEDINPTLLSMFYGQSTLPNEESSHIISNLKKKGFITAQSSNICSQILNKNINTNIMKEKFDHENIAMFCDPLYNSLNVKNTNIKGINSAVKRCLYGKNTYEYVLEYGTKFWNAYPDNNKFLLLGLFDGSERSGEVVKYMDYSLSDFLIDLINQRKFHKTALFVVSASGELKKGVFNKYDSEYFYEKNLGSFFIILNRSGMEQELINNMKNNQQSFVTAYDIYDTLLSIGNNCYDDICWEKMENKSRYGKNVFSVINSKERVCENYEEIKEGECYCLR